MSAIDDKWQQVQWIGQPVDEGAGSAEMALPDGRGRARDFQNGTITWSPETGAHEVHGAIRVKWAQLRGERGYLGYPTTDEGGTPDGRGRFNHFEHGSVYWRDDIGAHAIHQSIRDPWAAQGWENGRLGYPLSDTRRSDGVTSQTFQGGTIVIRPGQAPQIAGNID